MKSVIQSKAKNLLLIGLVVFFFILPVLSAPRVAQAAGFPYWGPLISCTGNSPAITGIPNPKDSKGNTIPTCSSICDLLVTIQNIFFFLLTLAIMVFAPIAIIWGAFLMITSAGSEERVSQGREFIQHTIMGIVFVLLAFLIVNTFMYFLAKIAAPGHLPVKWNSITCSPTQGISIPK